MKIKKNELNYLKHLLIEQEEVLYARTRTDLNNEMKEVRDNFRYLERSVASIQKNSYCDFDNIKSKLFSLEKDLNLFEQYNRRESIEISGLPDDISQNDLERILVDLLRRVGVWGLSSFEIAAYHRLKRNSNNENFQRVIIRFTNRKRSHECLLARRYIRDTIWEFPDLFIHESLCFKFKDIHDKCNDLKSRGFIEKL